MNRLKYIHLDYLAEYKEKQAITLLKHFNKIKKIGNNLDNLQFYLSGSAVYSSMIEGNIIDFDSYLKYSSTGMNTSGKSFKEIEDLKKAYLFAREQKLDYKNFLLAHKILTNTILEDAKYRGKIRDKNVYVFSQAKIVFAGADKDIVKSEMKFFFNDIDILLKRELSTDEIFYFASMLHLILVQIHPFADGNGRAARLLEKWFLAQKLGQNAWYIQSEKLYHKRRQSYYKNVHLGNNYTNLNYNLCLPFLLMLPMALRLKA